MVSVILSLSILLMPDTKIILSFVTKLEMLIATIGIISTGTGMLGTKFGIEIVMIKKNFNFHSKDQG